MSRHVKPTCALGRQCAGIFASHKHLGQDVEELPAEALGSHKAIEFLDHPGIVSLGFRVDGNHARGVADAEHPPARELPVDVSGQSGEEMNVFDVRLLIEHTLVEMRNAPAQGHVEVEKIGEFGGRLAGIGVAPSAERYQNLLLLVECHVPVHHGADADGGQLLQFNAVLALDVGTQLRVAVLQSCPNVVYAVSPQAVHKLVFPCVAALGYGFVFLVDEHGLDTGRAKLYAQHCLAGRDG